MVPRQVTPFAKPQYTAAMSSRTPGPVRIDGGHGADGTWVRPMPMPGSGVMSSVFSTIHLGEEGVTVIDPGWPGPREEEFLGPLDDFLRERGRRLDQITDVIVTHMHPDHVGAASVLLKATGARYAAGAVEWASAEAGRDGTGSRQWRPLPEMIGAPAGALDSVMAVFSRPPALPSFVPKRTPDVLLNDGDLLADYGLPEELGLRAVITPGHTPGHMTLAADDAGFYIAADMILPEIQPGIGLGISDVDGNPVVDYLGSLQRISEFDDYLVIPGHGYVFTGLAARRRETAEHVLGRAREVSDILGWNPEISIWRLAGQLTWSGGWEEMKSSPLLFSALRQTMMYRELVLRGDAAGGDAVTRWEQSFDLDS